jgi:hypothetical protein
MPACYSEGYGNAARKVKEPQSLQKKPVPAEKFFLTAQNLLVYYAVAGEGDNLHYTIGVESVSRQSAVEKGNSERLSIVGIGQLLGGNLSHEKQNGCYSGDSCDGTGAYAHQRTSGYAQHRLLQQLQLGHP